MIYTIGQIKKSLRPSRGNTMSRRCTCSAPTRAATRGEASDLDFLVDTAGTGLTSLMKLGALQVDLEAAFEKPVDLLPVSSLEQAPQKPSDVSFRHAVLRERVCLYTAP